MNVAEDHEENVTDILGKTFPTLISAFGVVLNVLSVCGILGRKPLQKWKNVFVFNLSLSDCVASLGILLKFVLELRPKNQRLLWTEPIFTTGLMLSILSTLAIALQRFIIVRFHPVGGRNILTPKRSVSICLIGWTTVATLHISAYYLEGNREIVSSITTTVIIWIALLITTSCYGWIYWRIAYASRFIWKQDGLSELGVNVNKRVIKTFALVIASTFVCWIPMSLILLMEGLGILHDNRGWVSYLSQLAFILLCLNQVINPIIYWSRLTEFRDQLRMCGGRRRQQNDAFVRHTFCDDVLPRHSPYPNQPKQIDMSMSNLTFIENDMEGNKLIYS